jgi:pimeloyl-ACP methyl ester carboxylesterase
VAEVIDRFTEVIGLSRFALYVFDYGALVGFRLAIRHPERITAVISQNGNAYLEGLSEGSNPIQSVFPARRRRGLQTPTPKFTCSMPAISRCKARDG